MVKQAPTLGRMLAMVGFAGGPATVLAYLLEGGGSQQFVNFRRALHCDDPSEALTVLARAMRHHLEDRVILNGRKTVVFMD